VGRDAGQRPAQRDRQGSFSRRGYRALRKATLPARSWLRLMLGTQHVQQTVLLAPEDRTAKRGRRHVLVDLVNRYLPASHVRIVEIGSAGGSTSVHLARYCPQIEDLYTVDIEAPNAECQAHIDAIEKLEFIHAPSLEAARRFADKSLDLIFIDADHCAKAVFDDLTAWEPKVKPGGVLAGHDYGSHNHPGVRPAVDFFFALRSHAPVRVDSDKVWWTLK
jgi:predicted O-methyltransferase YrrM